VSTTMLRRSWNTPRVSNSDPTDPIDEPSCWEQVIAAPLGRRWRDVCRKRTLVPMAGPPTPFGADQHSSVCAGSRSGSETDDHGGLSAIRVTCHHPPIPLPPQLMVGRWCGDMYCTLNQHQAHHNMEVGEPVQAHLWTSCAIKAIARSLCLGNTLLACSCKYKQGQQCRRNVLS